MIDQIPYADPSLRYSADIDQMFPRSATVCFMSALNVAGATTATGVANTDTGYYTMMQMTGVASNSPDLSGADLLRPVELPDSLLSATSGVLVKSVSFYAYDPIISGGSGQDADNLAAIDASVSGSRNAYGTSRYTNGIIVSWNPNWFRPLVRVNDTMIINRTQTAFRIDGSAHRGDISIGSALPYTRRLNVFIPGKITTVSVSAKLIQYLPTSAGADKFQYYPLMCEIEFGLPAQNMPPMAPKGSPIRTMFQAQQGAADGAGNRTAIAQKSISQSAELLQRTITQPPLVPPGAAKAQPQTPPKTANFTEQLNSLLKKNR